MSLDKLQESLLNMSDEKKLALIQELRSDRRVSKHAITHKVKQSKTRVDKMVTKFESLSPEAKAELRQLLGG